MPRSQSIIFFSFFIIISCVGCVGTVMDDTGSNDSYIDSTSCQPTRNNSCKYMFSSEFSSDHVLSYVESKEGLAELLVEVSGNVPGIEIIVDGLSPSIQYKTRPDSVQSIPFYLYKPLTNESIIQVRTLFPGDTQFIDGQVKIVALLVPCAKPC